MVSLLTTYSLSLKLSVHGREAIADFILVRPKKQVTVFVRDFKLEVMGFNSGALNTVLPLDE